MMKRKQLLLTAIISLLLLVNTAAAQTTAFTFQGKLTDSGNLANGNYDLQFKLFDALSAGTQQGSTQTVSNVTVTNGIFTVSLDFGVCAACFNGAARFLEIAVRLNGGGSFTTLTPRQPVTSTPYAINAAQLGGLAASGFLQNSTSQQAASNFNISGDGTAGGTLSANIINATTQLNLGGSRLLSAPGSNNLFVGFNAGNPSTTGSNNAFFGAQAGQSNTTGSINAFFGTLAGQANTTGFSNAYFGSNAGSANSTGFSNAFFGYSTGGNNTTGSNNAFFGTAAGLNNSTGQRNTFIGDHTDFDVNSPTSDNTLLGFFSRVTSGISNATAIGSRAQVSQNNSLVLGSINGTNGATADTNVGIGTPTPAFRLDVVGDINTTTQYNLGGLRVLSAAGLQNLFAGINAGTNNTGIENAFFGFNAGQSNTTGQVNAFFGFNAGQANTTGGGNTFFGAQAGQQTTTGFQNVFFGDAAGFRNTTGSNNTFMGYFADFNAINPTGNNNTLLGAFAQVTSGFSNATAIGAFAQVSQSNSLVLGGITGVNGGTNVNVGIGTTAPLKHLHVAGAGDQEIMIESTDANGIKWTLQSSMGASNGRFEIIDRNANASRLAILNNGNVGIGTAGPLDKLHVNGILRVQTLGAADTTTTLCRNSSNQIATCNSSSLRYKTAVQPFVSGLEIVNRLRPITFTWKQSGIHDLGFAAEEVAKVEPLFTFTNEQGQVEGVKYDRLSVVLVNAVKEQQAQLEHYQSQLADEQQRRARDESRLAEQQQQLSQQQHEIDNLKRLACLDHPKAAMCKAKK